MFSRDKYSKIVSYPGLELSLQFTSFTKIKLFTSFGNTLEEPSGMLTVRWHLNFFMFIVSVHGMAGAP